MYAQLDVKANIDIGYSCYFLQIQVLKSIHEHNPNSAFILKIQNITEWISSIRSWHNMDVSLSKCNIPSFTSSSKSRHIKEELTRFYNDHIRNLQSFIRQHPSHRLVEIQIEDSNDKIGQVSGQEFGILQSC